MIWELMTVLGPVYYRDVYFGDRFGNEVRVRIRVNANGTPWYPDER